MTAHVSDDVPELRDFDELVRVVSEGEPLYARYSNGPRADRGETSRDYESGLELPGLAVNPLCPEHWWTRPLEDWVARQLCSYVHLRDEADDERVAWVLHGKVVARGPDNEPLVAEVEPVALLADELIETAKRLYAERFDVARDSLS